MCHLGLTHKDVPRHLTVCLNAILLYFKWNRNPKLRMDQLLLDMLDCDRK